MAEDCPSIGQQAFLALRKTAFVFFEIILSAGGVIAASALMIYGFGLVRYIDGEFGLDDLFYFVIFCTIGIVCLILFNFPACKVQVWLGQLNSGFLHERLYRQTKGTC